MNQAISPGFGTFPSVASSHLLPQPLDASASIIYPIQNGQGNLFPQDVTLSQLNRAVNDVEMQDPPDRKTIYLIWDTNQLLDHLKTLVNFSEDVERLGLELITIIPSVVLSELDGLKKNSGLAWFARTASTVLLKKVKEKKSVRLQNRAETLNTPHAGHETQYKRGNDIDIYDCCLYFRTKGHAVLISADVNLSLTCAGDDSGILTVVPPQHAWSSRDLAQTLFKGYPDFDPTHFRGPDHDAKYRPSRKEGTKRLAKTEAPKAYDDDSMDIDDEGGVPKYDIFEDYQPSHALDDLHRQIISHFSIVFWELCDRVRRENGDDGPDNQSRHAPEYRKKAIQLWTVGDCLDYLGTKKKLQVSDPPLRIFLLRRNEDRGWRRGQDWSRQAWENVLKALEDVGRRFEDSLVLQSLAELRPHVTEIFLTRMRPTGQ